MGEAFQTAPGRTPHSPSLQDTPFGLYAPSGAPRGQTAKGGPRDQVRRPSGMLREGETAGTVRARARGGVRMTSEMHE